MVSWLYYYVKYTDVLVSHNGSFCNIWSNSDTPSTSETTSENAAVGANTPNISHVTTVADLDAYSKAHMKNIQCNSIH